MKNFDVKEHTSKYMAFAKEAGKGTYPNKKTAQTGSAIGLGLGSIFLCVGIYGVSQSAVFGTGSLIAGVLAITSNAINLKRLKSK